MDEKKKGVDASIEDDREVWVLQMGQQCHERKSFKQQRTVIQFVALLKFCQRGGV